PSGPATATPPAPTAPPSAEPASPAEAEPVPLEDLATAEMLALHKPWKGDYKDLGGRPFLRALVPFSRTLYYLDGPVQKGIAYEELRELEKQLPPRGRGRVRPKIVVVPTSRGRLLPALKAGYGDIAIGAFTVTESRKQHVDFSIPTLDGIEE